MKIIKQIIILLNKIETKDYDDFGFKLTNNG